MISALVVSQVMLWVVVVVLAAAVLALARQIGVLHERVAPMGALTIDHGPKVGEQSPVFELRDLRQQAVRIGGASPAGKSTLVLFVSPTCPVCKKLLPIAKAIARSEAAWLELVLSSDGEAAEQEGLVRTYRLEEFPYLLSGELGMSYHISKLPYAVLIDELGVVRAKGLTNTREHLESIIQAKQLGVASLQEYLRARTADDEEPTAEARRVGRHHG